MYTRLVLTATCAFACALAFPSGGCASRFHSDGYDHVRVGLRDLGKRQPCVWIQPKHPRLALQSKFRSLLRRHSRS